MAVRADERHPPIATLTAWKSLPSMGVRPKENASVTHREPLSSAGGHRAIAARHRPSQYRFLPGTAM